MRKQKEINEIPKDPGKLRSFIISLKNRVVELTNLTDQVKADKSLLGKELINERGIRRKSIDSIVEQLTESETQLSYIIVNENGRIIATTPQFRNNFYYNEEGINLKGLHIDKAIKSLKKLVMSFLF